MPSITLFVEDFGHEEFITAWIDRFSRETRVHVEFAATACAEDTLERFQELGRFVQDVRRGS